MNRGGFRFLDPALLVELKNLQLVARAVVEGFLAGVHPSRRYGPGTEFGQFRSYQPGDDPRRLDWKIYGRSDRFFVRESQLERGVDVRLLHDTTASMGHGADQGRSKFEVARLLGATILVLADWQGDVPGLHTLGEGRWLDRPPRRRRGQLTGLLAEMERLEPVGRWSRWSELHGRLAGLRGRSLCVMVGDFHQAAEEQLEVVRKLRAARQEVLVFQLLSRDEVEFSYRGQVRFEDLETGREVIVQADEVREAYLDRLSTQNQRQRQEILRLGAEHVCLMTDEPLELGLRRYLGQRRRMP